MAKIEKILEKNEKKLQISKFLDDACKEVDAEGNLKDDDFVTIRKIPYDIKIKIKYLSMKSFGGATSKELLKKYKASGHSMNDLQNLNTENSNEIMDFMLDVDFTKLETDEMSNSTLLIEKYIIDFGVDPYKHSFIDADNKSIELNYETLNTIGNENLVKYIIDNIKTFSKGFMLGE